MRVEKSKEHYVATLCNDSLGNAISGHTLTQLDIIISQAAKDPSCKVLFIRADGPEFCRGMNFAELLNKQDGNECARDYVRRYMKLLRNLSTCPVLTVAVVDGSVTAGGVGLVAACDYSIATARGKFCLSESLWGLIPACVAPYLIRRIGFQVSYRMAMTAVSIGAEDAKSINLVDELVGNTDDAVRKLILRMGRVKRHSILDMKGFFNTLNPITDSVDNYCIETTSGLLEREDVLFSINNYINKRILPWE